jgi:hypothetical protein
MGKLRQTLQKCLLIFLQKMVFATKNTIFAKILSGDFMNFLSTKLENVFFRILTAEKISPTPHCKNLVFADYNIEK